MSFTNTSPIEAAAQLRTRDFAALLERICDQKQLDQIEAWANPPEVKAARMEDARAMLESAGVTAETLAVLDAEIAETKPVDVEPGEAITK